MQGFTAVFRVLRLLTPLKMSYEAAKKRAEPYTKIVEELPQMRREAVQLARQAVSEGRHAYVLVNNRSEENAPLTVQALSEMLHD
jgi:proteasome assembly chaperone (PAC2) family protein